MHTDIHRMLELYFGYSTFREGQEPLIRGLLEGRDVLGIMPTGGGKSICYQLPGLIKSGVTLVISPLISLMRDQVLSLKASGIPAAYINSTLTPAQLQAVYRNLLAGQYRIVYVAPERLEYGGFQSVAAKLPLSFIAVDEAHCISQWGQDFRPSYLRIVRFLQALPVRPPVGAFTATATTRVREDIERILQLHHPVTVVTGFDRPNLSFTVLRPQRKETALLSALAAHKGKSGIVYCATRKKVEQVCDMLQRHGYAATRYHAGLDEEERRINQEDFLYDRRTVMVATNAFGMGIDKSNVGFVIHYNMPKSMEAYYQEAGRAGRDGAPADCLLLFSSTDITTAKFLIQNASENEELTEQERETVRKEDLRRLDAMVGYCKTNRCLRGYILAYFGQAHPAVCGNCSSCKGEFETVDITREAQMLLSCIRRIEDKLGYRVGITTVLRTLRGSKDQRLLDMGLDGISTYGLMKTADRTRVRQIAEQLEADGYFITEDKHSTVRLTAKAAEVLYRGATVSMRIEKAVKPTATAPAALSAEDTALYDALRELRTVLAAKAGVPAYVVFSNATLLDMARKRPRTKAELRSVSGVGEAKAARYGDAFLKRIAEQ